MDPLSGLLMMIEALADGEHDDCEDRCAAYKTWRMARGYKPVLVALDDCCDPASPYHAQFPIAQYAATHGLILDADVIANHVGVALYEARSKAEAESVDDEPPALSCAACGSENLVYMGALGARQHYRCRACGIDSSAVPE